MYVCAGFGKTPGNLRAYATGSASDDDGASVQSELLENAVLNSRVGRADGFPCAVCGAVG